MRCSPRRRGATTNGANPTRPSRLCRRAKYTPLGHWPMCTLIGACAAWGAIVIGALTATSRPCHRGYRTAGPPVTRRAVLDFRILGPLEVRDGDRLIELAGHRQQALLCALLVRANQVVPTERLVDELWGEDAPRTAT